MNGGILKARNHKGIKEVVLIPKIYQKQRTIHMYALHRDGTHCNLKTLPCLRFNNPEQLFWFDTTAFAGIPKHKWWRYVALIVDICIDNANKNGEITAGMWREYKHTKKYRSVKNGAILTPRHLSWSHFNGYLDAFMKAMPYMVDNNTRHTVRATFNGLTYSKSQLAILDACNWRPDKYKPSELAKMTGYDISTTCRLRNKWIKFVKQTEDVKGDD